ncbi:WxL domain-containing protein [Weissella confusa]|uniref:WxL domain-containing protein n=1 Tax=Weissella confusa TaxID=1583 RepID=UPI0018F12E81|nr:WxL domain-containing protein [Weissella confusa]MBJ7618544.1 hypothetical protein [Weissella confusa]MBJ7624553.1 hypothetical protein [Weissella confusa]MBJ7651052.1 hypothetical protein [Weissella confusa]MBJ7676083.1 hypothetical protein [Weissella confusa]
MAFAISRNQLVASVLVAGSILGFTSAVHADSQIAHGTASVDVVSGTRTLDKVAGKDADLYFGKMSLDDLASGSVTRTATLQPGMFQVTDNSGNKNGWQLTAAVTNFKDAANEKFDGGLKFDSGLTPEGVKLTADDNQKTGLVIYTGTQRGPWDNELGQVEMTVPSTANVGHYSADILYTLSDGKVNE